jgi:HNH endonuclease
MLLMVDDPSASTFNVADAAALDGRRATVADQDGNAFGRATLRALSPAAIRLEDRDDFAPADRYFIRDSRAVQGLAIRLREAEIRPEQAAFRERVGEAWGWRCAVTGEAVREVLDAAHLPGSSWRAGHNAATDGILLRADLHRLLDAGLLRIESGIVRVSVGSYAKFDGQAVAPPVGDRKEAEGGTESRPEGTLQRAS